MGTNRTDISVDEAFPPTLAPKEYQQREIFAYGRYINCQILNWDDGRPPVYLACNPLDRDLREPFLATQMMGAWCRVDLVDAINTLVVTQKENTRGVFAACDAEISRLEAARAGGRERCAQIAEQELAGLTNGGARNACKAIARKIRVTNPTL